MHDELIKNLRHDSASALQNCEFDFVHAWMLEAADAIEELQKDLEQSKDFEAFWQHEAEEALKKFQVAISNKPQQIPVTEMNCASCKYAIFNMFVEPCCNCNKGSEFKPKSNAERIRSMTDEELARMLAIGCHETRECPTIWNPIYPYDEVVESCEKCWLEWLKEEGE